MKRILLLNASPRQKGTSRCILDYMKKQIEAKGHTAIVLNLIDFFEEKMPFEELIQEMKAVDSIGFSISCYVNTFPYPSIWCLEKIADLIGNELNGKSVFAIAHGGMPYKDVHEPCLMVCECFAEQFGMTWLGGIIRGLSPLINGKPLEEAGGSGKKLIKALNLMIDDVLQERNISAKAQEVIKLGMPSIMNYPMVLILNALGKKDRKARGVVDFDRKPYL